MSSNGGMFEVLPWTSSRVIRPMWAMISAMRLTLSSAAVHPRDRVGVGGQPAAEHL
jgi:hypothetical protein